MIDPLLTLSFNLQAQRGTYALLIGSGVSRSSGIPTGWEVTLDLVQQLAHIEDKNFTGNALDWYVNKYGKDPDYSDLLPKISPTSAAQQQLLKKYFEPTLNESQEGKKTPTSAHHAIADLVSKGYVKVIITTNFDRLIESALEAKGISPTVIASPDAAKGAQPLVHSACTVIKVHGDYHDRRIKNSKTALSKYDVPMKRLLEQVFDEYGLIICGWSSDYDTALRAALERSRTRRYPMYWTEYSTPSETAKSLITLHKAHSLKIEGADKFFLALLEKVDALEEFNRPHPISTQAAVASLKRYLSEDKYYIQLRELLINEATKAHTSINFAFAQIQGVPPDQKSTPHLMKQIEASCETLIYLFENGSLYGKTKHAKTFFDAFEVLLNGLGLTEPRYTIWDDLKRYAALLNVYAVGLSAVASENYVILNNISSRKFFIKNYNRNVTVPTHIYASKILNLITEHKYIPEIKNDRTPASYYIFGIMREPLRQLIPDDEQYERIFDNFEYLWCLLYVDGQIQDEEDENKMISIPVSAFIWRRKTDEDWFKNQVQNAVAQCNTNWPPLKGGLFGGSIERLSKAFHKTEPSLDELRTRMRLGTW